MTETQPQLPIVCCVTGETVETPANADGSPKLPKGWKRLGEQVFSPEGWRQRTVLRGIVLPIAFPIPAEGEKLPDAKKRLWTALRTSWDQAASAINFAVTELAKSEAIPAPGEKLGKSPKRPDLYGLLREHFGAKKSDIDSQSLSSVLQQARKRYGKFRFDVFARHDGRLPLTSRPTPLPIQAKDVKIGKDAQGKWLLETRIAGHRFTLLLARSRRFARQFGALEKLIQGEAKLGEIAIYPVAEQGGEHRSAGPMRDENGKKRKTRLMVRVSLHLPRREIGEREGTLVARTGRDHLLTATAAGRAPWRLNADHVRQRIAGYTRRQQRMAEDTKYEKRWPAKARRALSQDRRAQTDKQRRWIDDQLHQISAMVAKFAERCGVAEVAYDDSERSFLPDGFPWYSLKQRLAYKLDERGIRLKDLNASDLPEKTEPAGA